MPVPNWLHDALDKHTKPKSTQKQRQKHKSNENKREKETTTKWIKESFWSLRILKKFSVARFLSFFHHIYSYSRYLELVAVYRMWRCKWMLWINYPLTSNHMHNQIFFVVIRDTVATLHAKTIHNENNINAKRKCSVEKESKRKFIQPSAPWNYSSESVAK